MVKIGDQKNLILSHGQHDIIDGGTCKRKVDSGEMLKNTSDEQI